MEKQRQEKRERRRKKRDQVLITSIELTCGSDSSTIGCIQLLNHDTSLNYFEL